MGEAKRKRDYRNRPQVVAKGFYEGKLSQRDASRMREDRVARESMLPSAMKDVEVSSDDESPGGLWFLLALGTICLGGLWLLWP